MIHSIENAIVNHRMLSAGDTVVLAVSGGPDSVCLLYLMDALASRWHWQIHVAHVHHGIRGADADQDLCLVSDLAAALGHRFHLRRCDVPGMAQKRGLGLEEAGRYARYQFFHDLAGEVGAAAVATGHHADDQAETVLMNLLRGAGGTGLAGIQPVRLTEHGFKIIRPLLFATRHEIECYLVQAGIRARHDRTNDELNQTRNRVRHELLPHLRQYNPRVTDALARTAAILRVDEQYFASQVESYLSAHLAKRYGLLSLSVAEVLKQPLALQRRILRRMLDLVSWEAKQSIDIVASVGFHGIEALLGQMQSNASPALRPHSANNSWSVPLSGGVAARLSHGHLFFLSTAIHETEMCSRGWRIPGKVELPEIGSRFVALEVARPAGGWDRRIHLDMKLKDSELCLRYWVPGDRIRLGEGYGSKKLSDLFIDAKVPAPYRTRVPIVACGREIVAVADLMVSSAYRPQADAPTAIELQFIDGGL